MTHRTQQHKRQHTWHAALRAAKLALLGLAATVLVACGGGGGAAPASEGAANTSQNQLNQNVKVIDQSEVADIISSSYGLDGSGSISAAENSQIGLLAVNQIAFLPAKTEEHQDFFVKITDKKIVNGVAVLDVATPAVHEVFSQLSFNSRTQAGLTTVKKESVFLANGVTKTTGLLDRISQQLGLLGVGGSSPDTYTIEIALPSVVKDKYADQWIVRMGCEKPMTEIKDQGRYKRKAEWMKEHCTKHVVIEGELKYKNTKADTNFELTSDGDSSNFNNDKEHYFNSESVISGELGISSKIVDANLSDLFSKLTQEDLFGSLSGYGFETKGGLVRARFEGLSAEDKKGKIPIMGVVASLGPALVTPANSASIKAASATVGMVFTVYAQIDINVNGELGLKLVVEPTTFNSTTSIKDGRVDISKTVQNDAGEKKSGDVNVEFNSDVTVKGVFGIPVDADLMVANMRILNATTGFKSVADMAGNVNGSLNLLTLNPELSGCFRMGFGGGVFARISTGLNVELGSSITKRKVALGFEYSKSFPEDETVDTVKKFPETKYDPAWPLWLYTNLYDGCISSSKPAPVWISADPDYRYLGNQIILNGNVPSVIKLGNSSSGSIDRVNLKYKKLDGSSFGSEFFVSEYDGVIENLGWNKENNAVVYKAADGSLTNTGVSLPAGRYALAAEMVEKKFFDFFGRTGTATGIANLAFPVIVADNDNPAFLDPVKLTAQRLINSVVTVAWEVHGVAQAGYAAVADGVSKAFNYTVEVLGEFTVTAHLFEADLSGGVGNAIGSISRVFKADGIDALISQAQDDRTTPVTEVPRNGTTEDTTPVLRGTISSAPPSGYEVRLFKDSETDSFGVATVVGLDWSYTVPADKPLASGLHSFTAGVVRAVDGSTAGGPRSEPYSFTVQAIGVYGVTPTQVMRAESKVFTFSGEGLPTSGLTITAPGDNRNTCQINAAGNSATGFNANCSFFTLGAQTLQINQGSRVLGTLEVDVASNVTDVSWASGSSTTFGKGTVKFGDMVTYRVTGQNLLADSLLGFAVDRCGVSNTEIGVGTDVLRTYQCWFNNEAGAVAGQMSGVVKDSPNGQALYNFQVPVETAPIDANSSIVVSWDLGSVGTSVQGRGTNPRTVAINAGVEIEGFFNNAMVDVDVSNDKVRLFNFRSYAGAPGSAVFDTSAFNGLVLRVPSGASWTFSSASVGSANTLSGLAASRLDLQAQRLAINLAGLGYDASTMVEVVYSRNISGNIELPASAFVRGVNVALSTNGYGSDTLMNAPPYLGVLNAAEWDFVVPVSGVYELRSTYATVDPRPVSISMNGSTVFPVAMSSGTGGFFPANRMTFSEGFVYLTAGSNVMRVSGNGVIAFPHIKGFSFVPQSEVSSGVFSVNAASETGTIFTVPSGARSCTFSANGTWNTTAPFTSGPSGWGAISSWPGYGVWTWKLFSAPMMSLIARRQSGDYVYVGNGVTLDVASDLSMHFVANDAIGGHYDNGGSVQVAFSCRN